MVERADDFARGVVDALEWATAVKTVYLIYPSNGALVISWRHGVEVSAKQLKENFARKDIDELLDLCARNHLTDIARAAIEEELRARGMSKAAITAVRAQKISEKSAIVADAILLNGVFIRRHFRPLQNWLDRIKRESAKPSVLKSYFSSRLFFLWLSIALWMSALAFPALITPDSKNTLGGINILLMGWLGVAGVEDGTNLLGVLAWWANLFYFWAIARAAFGETDSEIATFLAVATASLTALLSSYALNAVPTFTPIIGYGPGVLLWFLAIFVLTYVVTRDAGHRAISRAVVGIASGLLVAYFVQVGWRAVASNDSERERLPAHSAKRGYICSATAPPLPIADRQEAIELKADSKHWLESLIRWGVTAVQVDTIEYKRAPEGSPESKLPPYLLAMPVSVPARYTLRAEGGYPFINKWSDGGDFVRLTVIDGQGNKDIGQLVYRREISRRLGFCPTLTYYPNSQKEEAIKWLKPFMHTGIRK